MDTKELKAKEKKWLKGYILDTIKEDNLLKEYTEIRLNLYDKYNISDKSL
jgi:hypothetical protein